MGPKFGREKILLIKLADLFLMPGLVGLAVLDCFAVGVPIVTTDYPYHSPEFAYLENGVNGIVTKLGQKEYASKVICLLDDDEKRRSLAKNALASSYNYSVENMVDRFAGGILRAINLE